MNKYLKYKQKYDLLNQSGGTVTKILYICNNNFVNEDIQHILNKYNGKHNQEIDFIIKSHIMSGIKSRIEEGKKYDFIFFSTCDKGLYSNNLDVIKDIEQLLKSGSVVYFLVSSEDELRSVNTFFRKTEYKPINIFDFYKVSVDTYYFKTEGSFMPYSNNALYQFNQAITKNNRIFEVVVDKQIYIIDLINNLQISADKSIQIKTMGKLILDSRKYKYLTEQQARKSGNMTDTERASVMKTTTRLLENSNIYEYLLGIASLYIIEKDDSKKTRYDDRCLIKVEAGDWGDTTSKYTKIYQAKFAVLNMANSKKFGGGYEAGAGAQEENLFRRTTCSLDKTNVESNGRYTTEMTNLINASKSGMVYLDKRKTHVCFRANEGNRYKILDSAEYFPFYELRSAAIDTRSGNQFSDVECQRRIDAQFNTLISNGIKHVILSAFGCGVFGNPPDKVAQCYANAIKRIYQQFNVIIFAIYTPSISTIDVNYTQFNRVITQNIQDLIEKGTVINNVE